MKVKLFFVLISILDSQRIGAPSYTGVSCKDHGYYELTIASEDQADAFRGISENINIDFFFPHNGARFVKGEEVKFVVQPEDKDAMDFFLKTVNFDFNDENRLDELIENEFDNKSGRSVGFDFNVYHTLQGRDANLYPFVGHISVKSRKRTICLPRWSC